MSDSDRMATFIARRAYPRVGVKLAVTFDSEHQFYAGLTANISEGGLFIATRSAIEPGTLLHLSFTLPTRGQPIEALAEVCWLHGGDAENGISPSTASVGLIYEDSKLSTSLSWDYAGHFNLVGGDSTEVTGWPAISNSFAWVTAL